MPCISFLINGEKISNTKLAIIDTIPIWANIVVDTTSDWTPSMVDCEDSDVKPVIDDAILLNHPSLSALLLDGTVNFAIIPPKWWANEEESRVAPTINDTNFIGGSSVDFDKMVGDRQSSPMVKIK